MKTYHIIYLDYCFLPGNFADTLFSKMRQPNRCKSVFLAVITFNINTLFSGGLNREPSNFTKAFMSCNMACRPQCSDFYRYDFTVSTSAQMSERTIRNIISTLFGESQTTNDMVYNAVKNMISVQIYFDRSDVTVIQTSEVTPLLTFIANIGGQLGKY